MFSIKYHISLLMFFLLYSNILCQDIKDEYYYWEPRPLRLLPSFIPIKDSSTYLWIDSSQIKDNEIIVYVINNSAEVLNFNGYQLAQIQPEFKGDDNNWHRVRSLFYGWCGTSFQERVTIKPKEFYIEKYLIVNGNMKGQIRYSFYGTNIESSNTIFGSFDSTEVEIAKYDDISYMYCDADYLANVIIKLPKPYKYSSKKFMNLTPLQDSSRVKVGNDTIIANAIDVLNKRFPGKVPEVMAIISKDKNHLLNKYAIDWLLKHKNK